MAKQARKTKRPVPKTVLRLPDLDQAKSAVLNSLSSVDAQRGYRHAIDEFIEWYCSEPRLSFSKTVVLRYRIHLESRHLAPGTINLRLGAVRRLAYEASDCGLLSPDLAAGIRRVKSVKKIGVRLGNWLTPEQSERLWNAPDCQVLKGKRDRALLAVLLACGLRRHEAVNLDFRHVQQREDHWAIVDLEGKAGHTRTIPMPGWVKGSEAIRGLATNQPECEASDCGLLSPDLAAGIRRVKGVKKIGVRLGNWLTPEQSQRLWNAPDVQQLKGKRDRTLLVVLLSCGLRRHEAVNLNFGQHPATGGTLGDHRPEGQGRSYQNNTDAKLG
jgi:site-specific recombinase XerD